MNKIFKIQIILLLLLVGVFSGCSLRYEEPNDNPSNGDVNNPNNGNGDNPSIDDIGGFEDDDNSSSNIGDNQGNNNNQNSNNNENNNGNIIDTDIDNTIHEFRLVSSNNNKFSYSCSHCGETCEFSVKVLSGTSNFSVTGTTLKIASSSNDTIYSISGSLYGNIEIANTSTGKIELELNGFKLTSNSCPIYIDSTTDVTISAKKDTENEINDIRDRIDTTTTDEVNDVIYANCDLHIQGKGTLQVNSSNNSGIHTKDDLKIKNLTLNVVSVNTAIKGNDSVTIESGNITLISKSNDGIKTTNSTISSKQNQKGDITISGGNVTIYSSCDGLDAAHNVIINEESIDSDTNSKVGTNINIYTDKYSKYSEEVIATTTEKYYIKSSSQNLNTLKYTIVYTKTSGETYVTNSKNYTSGGYNTYYFEMEKPSGYDYLEVYAYNTSQTQGDLENYYAKSEKLNINNSYDCLSLSIRTSVINVNWTNKATQQPGGRPGGFGGMNDGNTDKGTYSTKGIKANNEVVIDSGIIKVKSYDDSIHASNKELLENGQAALGNITINGGAMLLYSNDDGIHADGTLTINNGNIKVDNAYEGAEGNIININGGTLTIDNCKDDGINATTTSGNSMNFNGGVVYINCTGDGIDSNSKTDGAVCFNGSNVIVISNSRNNSAIDTERGYSYKDGIVVAIGISSGMTNETTDSTPSFSTIGTTKTLNLTTGNYLTISDICVVRMPIDMNSHVAVLGMVNATITQETQTSVTLDSNGVYFK